MNFSRYSSVEIEKHAASDALTRYQRNPSDYTKEERREIFRNYEACFPSSENKPPRLKSIQVAGKRILQTNKAKKRKEPKV